MNPETKDVIIEHIVQNAKLKSIYIDIINGNKEHLHCIISLHPEQSLAKVIQLIKGESSFWINRNKITKQQFEWADEYFGVSFGESQLQNVRTYIRNQEEHHRIKTWEEEYNEFIAVYGFQVMKG